MKMKSLQMKNKNLKSQDLNEEEISLISNKKTFRQSSTSNGRNISPTCEVQKSALIRLKIHERFQCRRVCFENFQSCQRGFDADYAWVVEFQQTSLILNIDLLLSLSTTYVVVWALFEHGIIVKFLFVYHLYNLLPHIWKHICYKLLKELHVTRLVPTLCIVKLSANLVNTSTTLNFKVFDQCLSNMLIPIIQYQLHSS